VRLNVECTTDLVTMMIKNHSRPAKNLINRDVKGLNACLLLISFLCGLQIFRVLFTLLTVSLYHCSIPFRLSDVDARRWEILLGKWPFLFFGCLISMDGDLCLTSISPAGTFGSFSTYLFFWFSALYFRILLPRHQYWFPAE
jgi:hypothetical protein